MKALVSGYTGSLGSVVVPMLLERQYSVIGYSRDELKASAVPNHPRLTKYLGDVRDSKRLEEASRGVDIIFHFAALKQVDMAEENPEECIRTNVVGTESVLHSQRVNRIPRVVLSATDKGAYPINVYGATKLLSERLVLRNPSNVVCRYGNVLASRGSVIEKFVQTLKAEQKVFFTHQDMTRFFLTIEDAAKFVVGSSYDATGGLKIPKMKAADIRLLARCVAYILGIKSYKEEFMGVRPGEKLHECLQTRYDKHCQNMGEEIHSDSAPQFTEDELCELITPIVLGFC